MAGSSSGNFPWFPLLIIFGSVLVLGLILWAGYSVFGKGFSTTDTKSFATAFKLKEDGAVAKIFDYTFGKYSAVLADGKVSAVPLRPTGGVGDASAAIITIAIWLFIFLTFGDIISSFSSFNKGISWVMGLLLTLIVANLHAPIIYLGFFLGFFAFAGSVAVVLGLVASFVAFIAVNWGVMSLGPWIVRRRMMMHAAKSSIESAAGGKRLQGVIEGLGHVGDSLRKEGKKK